MTRRPSLIWPALAVALVPVAAQFGLLQRAGAHPWWDTQVAWIGAVVGFAIYVGMRITPIVVQVGTGAALAIGGYLAAQFGQAGFAASFGEDAAAGQYWYVGWIAAASGAAVLLALIARATEYLIRT